MLIGREREKEKNDDFSEFIYGFFYSFVDLVYIFLLLIHCLLAVLKTYFCCVIFCGEGHWKSDYCRSCCIFFSFGCYSHRDYGYWCCILIHICCVIMVLSMFTHFSNVLQQNNNKNEFFVQQFGGIEHSMSREIVKCNAWYANVKYVSPPMNHSNTHEPLCAVDYISFT